MPRGRPRAAAELLPVPSSSCFNTYRQLLLIVAPFIPDMALPRSNYDPRRVCINPFPGLTLGKHRRTIGIYLAGGLVRVSLLKLCLSLTYIFTRFYIS